MDKIEEINGSIVITRTTMYKKIYLGTIQYNKYFYGKYNMYNESGLIQTIYINKDYLLTTDEIDIIFKKKLNDDINYKYIEENFNKNYVYLENDYKINLENFISPFTVFT